MACAISCMRGVPASAAMTREAVTTPYSTAITPQPMTAQRTVDILAITYCFDGVPRPARTEYESAPGARRAENDRPPPSAQHATWEKTHRLKGLASGARRMAQAK